MHAAADTTHVMDVRDETAVSQRAPVPGSDQTSYPADVAKLTDWDQKLSVIAEEAIDLQHELSQLREGSDAVVQLLEQREHELEEKTASLVQLAQEREQTETSTAAANASLSEAQALLQADRERMASLEQELHSLRAHVVELEELETRRAATPPQPGSHLRLVALPTGYALSESPEPPPQVGELIGIDGKRYAVASSGRSPLPGDERPCVLLLVEPSGQVSNLPEAFEPAADSLASL
jgi:chromosome segregation ATPase